MEKMNQKTTEGSISIQIGGDINVYNSSEVPKTTLNANVSIPSTVEELSYYEKFSAYLSKAYNKYSKTKTLFYTNEEQPFYDFFICNDLSTRNDIDNQSDSNRIIKNATLKILAMESRWCILAGMAGIGKSMMMRHLLLDGIKTHEDTGLYPVLIMLREYKGGESGLLNLIVDSFTRFDTMINRECILRLLSQGRCQLLLDGVDEIRTDDLASFLFQLDYLSDQYPMNQFVISSRRINQFIGLSKFKLIWINGFRQEQSFQLIDALKYYNDEPELKERFKRRLKESLFETHREFATNPLLLTLMFINFRIFTSVPSKRHLFYRQAYETLLQKHDGNKLVFSREYHSVEDPSDFTDVFSEFCARSYRRAYYEFNDELFKKHFDELHSTEQMNRSRMNVENFKYDVLNSSCLMYKEGDLYFFLHRSFQEYFFADYYSRQDDTTLIKLGEYLCRQLRNDFDESHAFDMLYDLSPKKVEQFIFIPYLRKIYEDANGFKSFFSFLLLAFYTLSYTVIDEKTVRQICSDAGNIKNHYDCHNKPFNIVMYKIFSLLGIELSFNINASTSDYDFTEFRSGVLVSPMPLEQEGEDKVLRVLPFKLSFFDEDPKRKEEFEYYSGKEKEENAVIRVGYLYTAPVVSFFSETDKYRVLIEFLSDKKSMFVEAFNKVSGYYKTLTEKYKKSDSEEDDF